MTELQRAILDQHRAVARGERGAETRLRELQAQFRAGGTFVRYPPGATIRIGPSTAASQHLRRKPRRGVEAISGPLRPYWQLGDDRQESWRLR